jgi:hypothetical protein
MGMKGGRVPLRKNLKHCLHEPIRQTFLHTSQSILQGSAGILIHFFKDSRQEVELVSRWR